MRREGGYLPKTIRQYGRSIQRWADWLDLHGRAAPDKASLDDALDYADTLPATYASRMGFYSSLRAYWCGFLQRPTDWRMRVPARPRMRYRGLEVEQAHGLLDAARRLGARQHACCCLLFYTALRRETAAAVQWSNVDLTDRTLTLLTKAWRTHVLPLVDDELLVSLAALPRRSTWVFPGRMIGTHISPNTVNEWVKEAGWAAGLGHVTPHQLRYTAGGTMLDQTGDLRATAEYLGHSPNSLNVTAGYTRTRDEQLVVMQRTLGRRITSATATTARGRARVRELGR